MISVGSGSVTLLAGPAQLPAGLTVVTTGGAQVRTTLATAPSAGRLVPGERVRVVIQDGVVTAQLGGQGHRPPDGG